MKILRNTTRLSYLILSHLILILSATALSQPLVTKIWEHRFNGIDSLQDIAASMDAHGCIFVLGTTLTTTQQDNFVVIRYSPSGEVKYTAFYNSPDSSSDWARDIIANGSCNVYVCGTNYSFSGATDLVTLKYDSVGNLLWEARFNGAGNNVDYANAITIDGNGNILVTGYSFNSASFADIVTIKYDASGVQQWVTYYNGSSNGYDEGLEIITDVNNNIYVTGYSEGNNKDIVLLKYNSNGSLLWEARYDGLASDKDMPAGIALDNSGKVIITGTSIGTGTQNDIVTLSYSPAGGLNWEMRYDGTAHLSDNASDIEVDYYGNIVISGGTMVSALSGNALVLKYSNSGNLLWEVTSDGILNMGAWAQALALDGDGNCYITGIGDGDYYTAKFSNNGILLWEIGYDSPALFDKDRAIEIVLDSDTNVYVTGYGVGNGTSVDIATVKYGQQECNIVADAGPDKTIFAGQSVQIGSSSVIGNTYSWSPTTGLSDRNIANPLLSIVNRSIDTAIIFYKITVTDAYGCIARDTVKITVPPSPLPQAVTAYSLSATRPDSTRTMYVYTRFGDSLKLEDIRIREGIFYDKKLQLVTSCNAGFFELTFEVDPLNPNSGYYDSTAGAFMPTIGEERQACACKVFEDLSELIEQADDPYSGVPSVPLVNIIMQKWNPSNPPGALGGASSYYLPDYAATISGKSGILDGEVWKTINGGFDSYYNLANVPLSVPYYHGLVQMNFINFDTLFHNNWQTANTDTNIYDLYSVILHEAIHSLGFASLIRSNGNSIFWGTRFFSRYDTHLRSGATQLVVNIDNCYNTISNADAGNITVGCQDVVFAGSLIQPVYADTPFLPGSSLSHFDSTCAPFLNYVMTPFTFPGTQERKPLHEEVFALCDIGYHLRINSNGRATFGTEPNNNFIYDSTYIVCGNRVAGVNDFYFDPANASQPYTLTVNQGPFPSITIGNILGNDENANAYECLLPVKGGGQLSRTSGNVNTPFTYYYLPSETQTIVLRYIPVDTITGLRGNITFVIIDVIVDTAQTPISCSAPVCDTNLVQNGDFESGTTGTPTSLPLLPDIFTEFCYVSDTISGFSLFGYSNGNTYTVSKDGLPPFVPPSYPVYDHTTGSTYMLIADAPKCLTTYGSIICPFFDPAVNCNRILWEQDSIVVMPGRTYKFSLWARLIFDPLPFFQIEINDSLFSDPVAITNGTWTQYCALYVADTTSVKLTIRVWGADAKQGRDFTIDDIEFRMVNTTVVAIDSLIPPLCPGNTILSANPSGGVLPYSFLWSNGQTTSSITIVQDSTYFVTASDSFACSASDTVDVVFDTIGFILSGFDPTCNGFCNGLRKINLLNGIVPFNYAWSDGQNDAIAFGLCAGTYTVTVTDSLGCSGIANTTVTEPLALTVIQTVTPINCYGNCNGLIFLNVTGGTPPYGYQWDNQVFDIGPPNVASSLCAGTYSVTVSDNKACSVVETIVVTQPPLLIASITADDLLCNNSCNGVATALVSGGIAPYVYTWSNNSTGSEIYSLCVGDYSVTVLDNNNCTAMDTVSIIALDSVIISSITPVNTNCGVACDGSATVSVTSGIPPLTYIFGSVDTLITQSDSVVTGLCSGYYFLNVIDSNFCGSFSNFTIAEGLSLSASATQTCDRTATGTASVTPLNGYAGFNYQWNALADNQVTATATGLDEGIYSVTVTDSKGCSGITTASVTNAVTYDFANTIVVNSDTVWNGLNIKIKGGIFVTAGATLEINNSTLEFSEQGYDPIAPPFYPDYSESGIFVDSAATLILNNDTLRGISGCPSMWDGIKVQYGGCSLDKGIVIMNSGNVLRDAHVGLESGTRDSVGFENPGGIIRILQGNKFVNNRMHVIVRKVGCPQSKTLFRFDGSEFLCDAPLLDTAKYQGEGTLVYIYITPFGEANLSISVRGCTFRNTGSFSNEPSLGRGTGIKSYLAAINIVPLDTIPNLFDDISLGIDANLMYSFKVDKNEFKNTYRGTYLKATKYPQLTRNLFTVDSAHATEYCMYLYDCTGYQVEENNFTATPDPYGWGGHGSTGLLGLVIYNSYPNSNTNRYYNNTFNTFYVASQGLKHNRGTQPQEGLKVKCNDFINNGYDVFVAKEPGISALQGSDENERSPAGNTFDDCTNSEGEIWVVPPAGNINYYHHADPITIPSPGCYTSSKVNLDSTGFTYSKQTSCPTSIDYCLLCPDTMIGDEEKRLGGLITHYDTLIDGDNTLARLQTIATKPAGQIKDELLLYSPYLSDTVLLAYLAKPSKGKGHVPPGHIKEVIIANSPVTSEVKTAIDNKGLPPGILNEIDSAQTGISARALLEAQINGIKTEIALLKNDLVRLYLQSDTIPGALDTIIATLENDNRADAKMALTDMYLAKGDTVKAEQTLSDLAAISGMENFVALKQLFIAYGEGIFSAVVSDPMVKQQIEVIAADTEKAGATEARILLEFLFSRRIPEIIILPGQASYKTGNIADNDVLNLKESGEKILSPTGDEYDLSSYPNPFNKSTLIHAFIPDNSGVSEIVISNILGMTLLKIQLKPGHNYYELKGSELPEGIFFYSLYTNQGRTETKKMAHIK